MNRVKLCKFHYSRTVKKGDSFCMLLTPWAHARDEEKIYDPESRTWYHAFRLLLYHALLLPAIHAGTLIRIFDQSASFNFFCH